MFDRRSGAVPAGWPATVPPPGAPDWESRAVGWLWDLVPLEYRRYDVLARYPALLARLAAAQVDASQQAARRGLATARADAAGEPSADRSGVPCRPSLPAIPPRAVEALLDAYEREIRRLAAASRAVTLVAEALAGRAFVPRL